MATVNKEVKLTTIDVQLETKVRWWFWYCVVMPMAGLFIMTGWKWAERASMKMLPFLVKTYVDGKRVKGNR